jgi:Sulfatase
MAVTALKEAGYRTVMVGKWHLGHADRKYWPRQRGFDYHYGAVLGEIDYYTHASSNVRDWYRNNKPVKEEGYVTQLLGKDAVARIMEHDPIPVGPKSNIQVFHSSIEMAQLNASDESRAGSSEHDL